VMIGTHPTTIGDDVTIGHGAIVHGCTLQDRILVGMGAIILNGVVVGSDSIVAAGTLLTEGTQVPPRSLVMGSPGKVRRELSDEDVASIRTYADRYVGYRLDYMNAAAGSAR
jgi:carbonic anhydrase/acetyltransferase-like protein (isoleucine patch superfamily)